MFDIIAQVVGIIAAVIAILSFQVKGQKGIMVVQTVSTSLWTLHFFMIGAYTGFILNLLCAIRAVIYSKRESKKWAASVVWIYIFTAWALAVYILTLLFFNTPESPKNPIIELLPVIGVIATTIGFRLDSGFKVRLSQLVSGPVWLIYNIFNGSIGGTVTEIFATCSVIIGIIRLDIKDLKKKSEK